MNNSNNFNVCEKCGTANPLIAKYCYQCGAHLKTPEDPIVCNNCNTVNSGSARYCKHCGNKLFRGSTVKICPRCNHTVNGDAYICERCGFEFVAMRPVVQNIPQLPQNAGGSAENRKPQQKRTEKTAGGAAADLLRSSRSARLRTAAADGISARGGSLDSRLGKEVRSKSEDLGCNHHDFVGLAFLYAFVGYPAIMPQNLAWRRNARILFRGRRKFQYGGTAVVELCGQFQFSQKLFRRRVDARHTCGRCLRFRALQCFCSV